ncbi:MAG: ABC transporter substrate-binding protein [Actinomycetota bacterium]|jgi:NitT/TauT family transport system substrate-binding protein
MRELRKRGGRATVRSMRGRLFALVAALALVMVACDGDGGGTTQPPSPGGQGEPELSTINLGLLPLADVAPVHIAIAEGFFEEEGLTVEIQIVESGATAIPALVSGDLDVTFGNYVSFFLASNEGLDLMVIADQNHATPGFSSMMTLPDSGIEDPADFEGRTFAVNALSNVAEITTRAQISDAGGDHDAVEYVEIAFPDMIAALDRGDVDGIFAVEPFVTIAEQELDAVEVADPYGGRLEGFPVAGFQATSEFAEANPNTVAAFQRAMVRASQLAADEPDRVVDILPEYTELSPELAANLTQPEFVSEIDPADLTVVADLMVEFGLLDEAPDVDALVIPTP